MKGTEAVAHERKHIKTTKVYVANTVTHSLL